MKSLYLIVTILLTISAADLTKTPSLVDLIARSQNNHEKIVGGKVVEPPFLYGKWLAAIRKDEFQFCAGSLFGPNLLVTAAHCSILGIPIEELTISMHRFNLSRNSDEEEGFDYAVKAVHIHPDFSYYTLDSDIAVWELSPIGKQPEMTIKDYVRLDNGKNSYPGRNQTVIGWGAVAEGEDASEVLKHVQVPVLDQQQCIDALGDRVTNSMLCAGGQQGADACQGDSGGPMIVMRYFNRPVLTGVVSWGKGCGRENMPGVYTRISVFRDWLRGFLPVEFKKEMDKEELKEKLFRFKRILSSLEEYNMYE